MSTGTDGEPSGFVSRCLRHLLAEPSGIAVEARSYRAAAAALDAAGRLGDVVSVTFDGEHKLIVTVTPEVADDMRAVISGVLSPDAFEVV